MDGPLEGVEDIKGDDCHCHSVGELELDVGNDVLNNVLEEATACTEMKSYQATISTALSIGGVDPIDEGTDDKSSLKIEQLSKC